MREGGASGASAPNDLATDVEAIPTDLRELLRRDLMVLLLILLVLLQVPQKCWELGAAIQRTRLSSVLQSHPAAKKMTTR